MRRLETGFNRVLLVLFLETIVLSTVSSFLLINIESTIVLFIFDFLFISLAFQLTSKLSVKLGLLALGNLFGLFCNFVFYLVELVGVNYFGEAFHIIHALFFPVMSVSWIVVFWSLTLAALPKPSNINQRSNIAA